jgi:hypothetical protein
LTVPPAEVDAFTTLDDPALKPVADVPLDELEFDELVVLEPPDPPHAASASVAIATAAVPVACVLFIGYGSLSVVSADWRCPAPMATIGPEDRGRPGGRHRGG